MNCIEVKGIHRLRNAYIKRWFGRAGPVEEVKIQDDRVIVVTFSSFRGSSTMLAWPRPNATVVGSLIKNLSKLEMWDRLGRKKIFLNP